MASMMGGDFVEAYVLKKAYKEKLRRLEELDGAKKNIKEGAGSAGESSRGGFFGLMKKKVHPKPKAAAAAAATSS